MTHLPGFIPYVPESKEAWKYSFLRGKVIAIEGTVGAGKSTLGHHLATYLNDLGIPSTYIPEYTNKELLNFFINDMKRNAYMFQLFMLEIRATQYWKAMQLAKEGQVVFIDRMMHGDIVFANYHKELGNINDQQYKAYQERVVQLALINPSLVIYLEVSPKKAKERCERRNRTGESKYDISYFEGIERHYRDVMSTFDSSVLYIPYEHDILVEEMESNVSNVLDQCIQYLLK